MKALKTTTTYSMKQTISKYVLPDLGDKKINEVTTLQLQKFKYTISIKVNGAFSTINYFETFTFKFYR